MKTIRCGIIGCGVIAPSHIESYRNMPGVEVSWACDIVKAKAEALSVKYEIANVTTDFMEMLADPGLDAVSICTDHGSHATIAMAALDAGKHVLCEKALSSNLDSLNAMMATHHRHLELVFAGVFQHRFEKVNRLVKELLERGVFGVVTTINLNVSCLRTADYYLQDAWRGTWQQEGGALLINQAIHFIDLVQWLGGGVSSLCGCCGNLTHQGVIETEDTAAIILRFRNGALGSVSATTSSIEDWRFSIIISGSDGYIELGNNEPNHYRFADPAVQAEVAARLQSCREEKLINANKTYYGEGHPAQIKDFVDAVRERRLPFIPAEAARDTVKIVLACYASSKSGRWVEVD